MSKTDPFPLGEKDELSSLWGGQRRVNPHTHSPLSHMWALVFCVSPPGGTEHKLSKDKQATEIEPVKIIYQFDSKPQNGNPDPMPCCSKKSYLQPPCLGLLLWDTEVAKQRLERWRWMFVKWDLGQILSYYLSGLPHSAVWTLIGWVNECGYMKQIVCKYKINEKYSLFALSKLLK